MRLIRAVVLVVLILICVGAIGVGMLMYKGVSALDEPSGLEISMAGELRHLAIPKDAREKTNPLPVSADNVKEGMEHFADHCSVCHANNGSGETPFGRGLYPRPPDLRAARTQALSDGEIFWIINNGVKLTGMPAFTAPGGPGDEQHTDQDTWRLVTFIRHLPSITPAEVNEMKKLNPHAPDEDPGEHHHGGENN